VLAGIEKGRLLVRPLKQKILYTHSEHKQGPVTALFLLTLVKVPDYTGIEKSTVQSSLRAINIVALA
jgi:hypothetical protein